jgi:hypothetical protein
MVFMLKDPFEETGQWWVPEKPDDKIYGTLRYSPTDIELVLSGTLDDVRAKDLVTGAAQPLSVQRFFGRRDQVS